MGEACQILAAITEISSYEEIAGSTINDKKAKMLAIAEIVGCIDLRKENKKIDKLLVPPNPGSRVYVPLKEFLQDILNRNTKGETYKAPVELGTFEGLSAEERANNGVIKSFIDANEFATQNTLISAVTGAGKTFITQKILAATQTQQRIIIFDYYTEYKQLPGIDIKVTQKTNPESLLKETEKSKTAKISAHNLTVEERKTAYSDFLKTLLKTRVDEKISPLLVIVEEAETFKGPLLEEAITLGAKKQMTLCLLTTHPSELGGKVLSNTSNQLIGKTVDAEDIQFLKCIVGKTDLSALMAGEWVMNGISKDRPIKTHVEQ
jgi:DNA helicase HerA-like ATPase